MLRPPPVHTALDDTAVQVNDDTGEAPEVERCGDASGAPAGGGRGWVLALSALGDLRRREAPPR